MYNYSCCNGIEEGLYEKHAFQDWVYSNAIATVTHRLTRQGSLLYYGPWDSAHMTTKAKVVEEDTDSHCTNCFASPCPGSSKEENMHTEAHEKTSVDENTFMHSGNAFYPWVLALGSIMSSLLFTICIELLRETSPRFRVSCHQFCHFHLIQGKHRKCLISREAFEDFLEISVNSEYNCWAY